MNLEFCFIVEILDDLLENLNEKKEMRVLFVRKMQLRCGFVLCLVFYVSKIGGDILNWVVGDKVGYKKWGIGIVVSVKGEGEGMEFDIVFLSLVGVKCLLVVFVFIEKQ